MALRDRKKTRSYIEVVGRIPGSGNQTVITLRQIQCEGPVSAAVGLKHCPVIGPATLIFGQLILPEVYRLLGKLKFLRKDDSICSFYLACMLGWALVPGLQIGLIYGASIPLQNEIDMSSLHGALIGMVTLPICAAVLGLLAGVVANSICWMFTGRSLSEH